MKHLNKSKLIRLLGLLPPKELMNFKSWLSSPWVQKNKYFLPFFKIIERTAPSYSSTSLTKEKVYTQLYGNKKYNNKIFNNLLLSLTKEVESYLVHLWVLQDETLKQQILGQLYLAQNEVKLFEKTTQQSIQKLVKKAAKSATDHLLLHQLNEAVYFQTGIQHRYQTEVPNLENSNTHLDTFYLLGKFKYFQEITARAKILKAAPKKINATLLGLLTELKASLTVPALDLYDYRLHHQRTLDWSNYMDFKKQYLATFDQLHPSFQQLFLFCCINDTIALYSKGIAEGIQELNGWYKFGFQHHLLLQNNSISEVTYNNIILVSSHIGSSTFIEDFITTYTNKLPPVIRTEAHRWAKAQLAYVNGHYEVAFQQLIEWLPQNDLYAIQAKITLLKANFKLTLVDASHQHQFNSHCLAFEKYIKRNKLYSKDRSQSYLKYIQFTRRICQKCYQVPPPSNWDKLLAEIDQETILFGKNWLKEVIKGLQEIGNDRKV